MAKVNSSTSRSQALLRAGGLSNAIRRLFADGLWHDIAEAVQACGGLISPETAYRAADYSGARRSFVAMVYQGRRRIVVGALRNLGAQAQRGPRQRWDRFRLDASPSYARRGEENGRARLTRKDIDEIHARYRGGATTQEALATEYGISKMQVSLIVRGLRWTSAKNDDARGAP